MNKVFCTAINISFLILIALNTIYSQEKGFGTIRGVISDEQTGEPIVGANIKVEGTTKGTTTDLEGKYSINLPAGNYTLQVTSLSYAKKQITNINVANGIESKLFITLSPQDIKAKEVIIEAKQNTSYEALLLTKRKKSTAISDMLSAEQIKKTPDATASDALRRTTGVTVIDNKYILIRGISERYNQTILNGMPVASTDPDKKSFSFDMLPANFINNTIITKSASPDLKGDFSGGIVQITTLDFPDRFQFKIGFGTSYNTLTTGKEVLMPQKGKLDWLGIDDGTRVKDLPPYFSNDVSKFLKLLPNNWNLEKRNASATPSIFFSLGNTLPISSSSNSQEIGYLLSFSYRNYFQHTNYYRYAPIVQKTFNGPIDSYNVLWSGIGNLSFRFDPLHKFSFKNSYSISSEQQSKKINMADTLNSWDHLYFTNRWTQRSIYSVQLGGEHQFINLSNTNLNWYIGTTIGNRIIPDRKEMMYYRELGSSQSTDYISQYCTSGGRRSWSKLLDRSNIFSNDVTIPISSNKFKVGMYFENKKTHFEMRAFNFIFDAMNASRKGTGYIQYLPIETVFSPENFGNFGEGLFYPEYNRESSKPTDSYWGKSSLSAYYFMGEIPFSIFEQKFRLTGGLRTENHWLEMYYAKNPYNIENSKITIVKHSVDYLPSANLTYQLLNDLNLKLAYSKTLNHPEFRELAFTDFYDYDLNLYEYGNPNLDKATIHNYDFRVEYFLSLEEVAAFSLFRKHINNAIEATMFFETIQRKTWTQSPNAECQGWEAELKKNFGFISLYMENLTINFNYTRISSKTRYKVSRYSDVYQERPLQGQSPYIINIGLNFVEPSVGFSVNILYNRYGERIDAVADVYAEEINLNIYEQPRDLIDITINQNLFWGMELKFTIKNLLGKDQIYTTEKDLIEKKDNKYIFNRVTSERKQTGSTYGFQISKTF